MKPENIVATGIKVLQSKFENTKKALKDDIVGKKEYDK